jgi:sialic acid synthase SpsE
MQKALFREMIIMTWKDSVKKIEKAPINPKYSRTLLSKLENIHNKAKKQLSKDSQFSKPMMRLGNILVEAELALSRSPEEFDKKVDLYFDEFSKLQQEYSQYNKAMQERRKIRSTPIGELHRQNFEKVLVGNQKKIDADGDGKISAKDFKILRNKKEGVNSENIERMAGAVTTTSPSSVKGKLFNISYSGRKKDGKEEEAKR